MFALVALGGVLALGVLPGLLVAAGLALVSIIQRLSRPPVGALARDPATGAWGRAAHHPDWVPTPGVVVARVDGPLFYANAVNARDQLLALVRGEPRTARARARPRQQRRARRRRRWTCWPSWRTRSRREGAELRLAVVRAPALELLRRRGLVPRLRIEAQLDDAIRD